MEEKLIFLLDYQRFQKNHRIEEMLQELEGKYGEELTEESFAAYQAQLESLGMPRILEIRQAAYDRYVEKANK